MYDHTALLTELETSLTQRSEAWRASALKKLTTLFVAGADHFSPQHVALYDAVLPRFVDNVDQRTLAEISAALAELQNAPPVMSERLARHKDAAVAGPVLEKSEALADGCLVDLASSSAPDHLLAMARRPKISAVVSDAILKRDDRAVNRQLVANKGALISEIGFVKMMDEAQRDSVLATAIRSRADIPAELKPFFEMLEKAGA